MPTPLQWLTRSQCLNFVWIHSIWSCCGMKQGPWERVPVPRWQLVLVLQPDLFVSLHCTTRASLSYLHWGHRGNDTSRSQPGEMKRKLSINKVLGMLRMAGALWQTLSLFRQNIAIRCVLLCKRFETQGEKSIYCKKALSFPCSPLLRFDAFRVAMGTSNMYTKSCHAAPTFLTF